MSYQTTNAYKLSDYGRYHVGFYKSDCRLLHICNFTIKAKLTTSIAGFIMMSHLRSNAEFSLKDGCLFLSLGCG